MLRRVILTFALALLFGLNQQGAVVHEISHYADINSSSQQQDKIGLLIHRYVKNA